MLGKCLPEVFIDWTVSMIDQPCSQGSMPWGQYLSTKDRLYFSKGFSFLGGFVGIYELKLILYIDE